MKIETNQKTIDKIKEIIADNGQQNLGVRLYIAGVGWGGPNFGMTLDEFNAQDDVKYEEDGLDFMMSKEIYKQFGDFLVQQVQHGYLIRPKNNAEGSASC